tara:strand:+ start:1540 stop:2646 length:1107 start_codon:yes stop_codon:yes gene_type:complete
MAEVRLKTFYPENAVTDSAEMNANNNALEGSLAANTINAENVRAEGIDFRNLQESLHIKEIGQLNNGYTISFGTLPATGARYDSYSVDINEPKEKPINHDETGATNTGVNKGTKLRLNGTAGVALTGAELITTQWNVNVMDNLIHANRAELVTKLIDTTTKDGGVGAPHPYGSGIGEWYWIIYPKFNTISNALNDSDFKDAKTAGLVDGTAFLDPTTITGINSITNNYRDFDERRWDHTMLVPSIFTAAGNVSTSPFIMKNIDKDGADSNNTLGGPQMMHSSFSLQVKASPGKTLFGVQLFISGYWRMHALKAGIGIGTDIGSFLEFEVCDPSRTNAGGDPIPLYGVSGQLALERIQTSCIIHKTTGA